jgi:toxin-antitoxin system PIN domain toxin
LSVYLLDVNVLVAMAWPRHTAHAAVQAWLGREGHKGWASCPFTQAGFVRIISNPAFSRDALSPQQALALLRVNLEHPTHHFWPAALSVNDALARVAKLVGHQQISDAYLLGLAIHNKARLATLDRSVASLLPASTTAAARIEVIR